jgi:hypothetical protein
MMSIAALVMIVTDQFFGNLSYVRNYIIAIVIIIALFCLLSVVLIICVISDLFY